MLKINVLSAFLLIGLTACGGGSGGGFENPKVLDGVFKDSNVSGLSFVSGREKGVTDNKGKFRYEEGKKISFSIGKVKLGSATGMAIMTPLDLVPRGNLASPKVINRVRFLMMLDKDNKPENGITISSKVQAKAKSWAAVNFAATDFLGEVSTISADASAADGVAHVLPSADVAKKHLKTTLLCSYAGAYAGAYSGSQKGNVALMVDPTTGKVMGSSYDSASQESTEIKAIKAINYDVGLTFVSAEDSGKKFSGKLTSTDKLSGSWVDSNNAAIKGAFDGTRVGGASTAVYRYTVAFNGDDKGLFTFDVDANNKVTGKAYSVSDNKPVKLSGKITTSNNEKRLKVKTSDDTEINGKITEGTLEIEGLWSNLDELTNGNFSGAGCRLN